MAESLTARTLEWTEVDGWLSVVEGNALRSLAAGKRVLELGTWKGRSTICMAGVAASVMTVDHHEGDHNTGPADTLAEFLDNVERSGMAEKVHWRRVDVARCDDLDAASYDLAFVDVEHSISCTALALGVALKCLKPGGVIAWHDADWPDVRSAVAAAGLHPMASAGSLEWCIVPWR